MIRLMDYVRRIPLPALRSRPTVGLWGAPLDVPQLGSVEDRRWQEFLAGQVRISASTARFVEAVNEMGRAMAGIARQMQARREARERTR